MELLNDDVYEICEEFEPQSVAAAVAMVIDRLTNRRGLPINRTVDVELGKYQFRVNNRINGFVSCSDTDEGCTGISRTLFFPYYEEDDDSGRINLIQMMNEAFVACSNC